MRLTDPSRRGDEADLIRELAARPLITLTVPPLFGIMLAAGLADMVADDELEEWEPFVKGEAKKLLKQIGDQIPEKYRRLFR
jgi:hypothetical protein